MVPPGPLSARPRAVEPGPALVLDTENIFWAFGFQTRSRWRALHPYQRLTPEVETELRRRNSGKTAALRQQHGLHIDPAESGRRAARAVEALLARVQEITGRPATRRVSFGKSDDSAVDALRPAFADHGVDHVDVAAGPDVADRRVVETFREHLDRPDPAGRFVLVGSGDQAVVWWSVCEDVDGQPDTSDLRVLVVSGLRVAGQGPAKLFGDHWWTRPGGRRVDVVLADTQLERRRRHLQHEYLSDLVHGWDARRKTATDRRPSRRASPPEGPIPTSTAPLEPALSPRRRWREILAVLEDVGTAVPRAGLDPAWRADVLRGLRPALSAAEANWVVQRLQGYVGSQEADSWRHRPWPDVVLLAIWLPHHPTVPEAATTGTGIDALRALFARELADHRASDPQGSEERAEVSRSHRRDQDGECDAG